MHFVYGKILHKILFSLQSRSECIHLGEKKLIGVKIDTQSRRSSKNDGPEIKKCTVQLKKWSELGLQTVKP